MEDTIITLKRFMFSEEAYKLMSLLQREGIDCFIADKNVVSIYPWLSNAVGGVKLKIKKSDAEKALMILKQYEQLLKKEEREKENRERIPDNYVKCNSVCPKCDSFNIYMKKISLFKTIFSIIFAFTIIPFFFKKEYFCADCKHIWKK